MDLVHKDLDRDISINRCTDLQHQSAYPNQHPSDLFIAAVPHREALHLMSDSAPAAAMVGRVRVAARRLPPQGWARRPACRRMKS